MVDFYNELIVLKQTIKNIDPDQSGSRLCPFFNDMRQYAASLILHRKPQRPCTHLISPKNGLFVAATGQWPHLRLFVCANLPNFHSHGL
jgi:hypothetical protein